MPTKSMTGAIKDKNASLKDTHTSRSFGSGSFAYLFLRAKTCTMSIIIMAQAIPAHKPDMNMPIIEAPVIDT